MKQTALLSIDVQQAFDEPIWGTRNNLDAEDNIAKLLEHWRNKELPVIHIQHCSIEANSPLREGKPGNAFTDIAMPLSGEKIFQKSVNSAFIGTGLEEYLHKNNIESLVIAGLTTDHCISTSTRMAGNLGFNVSLISDATATFDRTGEDGTYYSADQIHKVHLASLHGEFCKVLTTKDIINTTL